MSELFQVVFFVCFGHSQRWLVSFAMLAMLAAIDGKWDLMIAHPPCTYLAVSGAQWYYHPDDKGMPVEERRPHPKYPDRAKFWSKVRRSAFFLH